jgi:aristolochene synthase
MDIRLNPQDLDAIHIVEQNCAKHIAIVNDIYSWEKELTQSQRNTNEGSLLCSAVKIMADNAGLEVEGAKRVLWSMVREWEIKHEALCSALHLNDTFDVRSQYVQGLKYQMSGNETWSKTTPRYLAVE